MGDSTPKHGGLAPDRSLNPDRVAVACLLAGIAIPIVPLGACLAGYLLAATNPLRARIYLLAGLLLQIGHLYHGTGLLVVAPFRWAVGVAAGVAAICLARFAPAPGGRSEPAAL